MSACGGLLCNEMVLEGYKNVRGVEIGTRVCWMSLGVFGSLFYVLIRLVAGVC